MSSPAQTDQQPPMPLRVLMVEDRETDMELIVHELKKQGFSPSWVRVDTEEDFLAHIHGPFDLITADAIMPQFSALRAVTLLQEHQLDIPCIIISGSIGEEEAVALIRAGGSDYFMKDRLARLGQGIHHVLDQRRLREEHRRAQKALVALNEELEQRVAERTAKLEEVNEQLAQELMERKQIELRLRRHEATLERRVAARTKQLERSHTRLQRLVAELTLTEQRERKQLASELHDYLAQLLVVSKLKIAQLCRNPLDKKTERLLQDVSSLLDQALTYCRTLVSRLSPVILFSHGLIAGLHWLTEYFSKQGLRVHVQSQVSAVPLPEDHSVLLFHSVRELLFNVLKHAGTGEATVDTMVRDGRIVQINVVDGGAGFDENALSYEATGYGLFSIRERIEGLGGTLAVHSSPGSGTRIELSVPLPDMVAVSDMSSAVLGTSEVSPSGPRSCRVMIVDDHAMVRQELAKFLTTMKEVTVIGEASDGREGVELAGTLYPDLILMDINMPVLDGIEATRQILAQNPRVKIVGVTINTDTDLHKRLIAAGAVATLTKDALSRDLEPTIFRILAQPSTLSSS
ncbi:MAG: response regulator [Nitrospira sp.]|nr:response regulator [Nitrospira sp.]